MAKVFDKKSIFCHCVSLKKHLSQEEQALMQPLEDSLRQQDKLNQPYGECYHCHDMGHWIGDCPEAKKLREQQMSTDNEPAYQPKLVDYSDTESSDDEDNIRPPPRKRRPMVIYSDDEDEGELNSQQSTVSTEKPSTKRKASDISNISPKRRRLGTHKMKTVNQAKTGKKTYCFICKSASRLPESCTEKVTDNWDKPISYDEPYSDSKVHIH